MMVLSRHPLASIDPAGENATLNIGAKLFMKKSTKMGFPVFTFHKIMGLSEDLKLSEDPLANVDPSGEKARLVTAKT
jgi:hypothetical protein